MKLYFHYIMEYNPKKLLQLYEIFKINLSYLFKFAKYKFNYLNLKKQ